MTGTPAALVRRMAQEQQRIGVANTCTSKENGETEGCGSEAEGQDGPVTPSANAVLLSTPVAAPVSTAFAAGQTRRRQILLVEDDPDSRACMRSLLEVEGYVVHTAADGAEALNRLRSGLEPGLIVLDLMMPDMDGFQFRKAQLQDPKLSTIPVVIYSGHHDVKANAALLEPTAYIQKPIDVDSFLDLVSAHCTTLQPVV
jgi:CheY-like chemotaxis protein